MFEIVLVFAVSFAACKIFERKIHETLPVAVFAVTLFVYAFSLILPLDLSAWICAITVSAFFAVTVLKTRKSGNVSVKFKLPLLILVPVCAFFCILMSERYAFYYDDLSYWALYAKNIFAIDKLPHLFENCSVDYKDYTPIMQIFQYLAMFGKKSFSESVCFQANVCFIYIMLLPVLGMLEKKEDGDASSGRIVRIAAVVLYVIFPHILTAQFYYRLGVDLFLALVFGYTLYLIFIFHEKDSLKDLCFRVTALSLSLAFLSLVKTSGIVLSALAVIFLVIKEFAGNTDDSGWKKSAFLRVLISAAFAFGSYLSWQLFLHFSWNNGYLSNRVKEGVSGGTFTFPEYTAEVLKNYVVHFFTYPLTRNRIGVTAFLLVLFIAAAEFLPTFGKSLKEKKKSGHVMFICSMAGLFVFMLAHISMYLFVFDDWEAHGLLEYDRYITQYLGGIFYIYVIKLIGSAGERNRKETFLLCAATVIFAILLPYSDMNTYLIPQNYKAKYDRDFAKMAKTAADEWDNSGIGAMDLPHDGSARITVVANAWDEETQFLEYTSVPQPFNRIVNVPAVDPGILAGFIMDFVDDYVYVCNNAEESYQGDWTETGSITSDGRPLAGGTLYIVDRSNDDKTLVVVK